MLQLKEGPAVRLAVSDSSKVNDVTIGKEATAVILEGDIDKVKVEAKGANLTVQNSSIQELEVVSENAAAKATIDGTGKVSKVNALANDIIVKTEDTEVQAEKGTTGVIAGGKPVKGGRTSNTNNSSSSGSSSSSESSNDSGSSNNNKHQMNQENSIIKF